MTSWFRPIEGDNLVSKSMVVHVEAVAGIEPEDLRRGRGVSAWDPAASVQVVDPDYDGEPDDVLQNDVGALPIFSTRLREALHDLSIGVDDIRSSGVS